MHKIERFFLLLILVIAIASVAASGSPITGLPGCTSEYQENCVSAATGGSTAIIYTPGETIVVYGVLSSGQSVYILDDLSTSVNASVEEEVAAAQAAVAQYAPYAPLPTCSASVTTDCIAANAGGSRVGTGSTSSSYVDVDTPVTQPANEYQTTIEATLNGSTVHDETFSGAYSSASVQAGILAADAVLAGDGASYDSPALVSNTSTSEGSQTSYVQTGPPAAEGTTTTEVTTFGPALIYVGPNQGELFVVNPGQRDIDCQHFD
jgi:hypothetical protein